MAEPIRITITDSWIVRVPESMQEEARRLDAEDLTPGDGMLSLNDSNGEARFEQAYERIAKAAVSDFTGLVDQQLMRKLTDPARRQEVVTKARLFADLKAALQVLGPNPPPIRSLVSSSNNDGYHARFDKPLHPDGEQGIRLTPSDTVETLSTKVRIAALQTPELDGFVETRMAGLDARDKQRLRGALHNVITYQGFSDWSFGIVNKDGNIAQAGHIGSVKLEADGRLVVTAPSGLNPGVAEYRVETLGGMPVLTGAWTSKDGKTQRLMMSTDNAWVLIRQTTRAQDGAR